MPTCLSCKKDVTSGYVVCGECAENMKHETMQPVLSNFTAWLGAIISQNHTTAPCGVCEFENADICLDFSVCRKGITSWLRAKANEFMETSGYAKAENGKEEN